MFFQPKHIIFPVDTPCDITLNAVGPVAVSAQDVYELRMDAFSGLRMYSARKLGQAVNESSFAFFREPQKLTADTNALRLQLVFPQEDRWKCTILRNGEPLEVFEVYSLREDLFSLNPYKGDNHMHSFLSDGKDSPEYMAAACCKRGYDYCVPTDHYDYQPSLRAKALIDILGVDFAVLPGEEIHATGNHVHIINLGGEKGVNDWYRDDPEGYEAAVQAKMAEIGPVMNERDLHATASSLCLFDKIHECNGVAVLCHPHWILQGTLQESEDITEYLFDHKTFDVYELIAGGAYEEGTQMQISYYQQRDEMPIVGSSDTHNQFGGFLEPGNFTVVFAPELSVEAIRESIRAGRTVAGNGRKYWGVYRLLKYANFLQANYFPQHDKRCEALGNKLLRYAASGADAESKYAEDARKAASPSMPFLALRWTKG